MYSLRVACLLWFIGLPLQSGTVIAADHDHSATGFYLSPRATSVFHNEKPMDDLVGKAIFGFGLTAGYRLFDVVSIEIGFANFFSDNSSDTLIIDTNLLIHPWNFTFTPYSIVGFGIGSLASTEANVNKLLRLGLGLRWNLWRYLKPFVQSSYLRKVNGGNDLHFFEQQVGVFVHF